MMPGQDRDVDAARADPLDEREVVGGAEEHLGDRELRAGPGLGDQHVGVGVERGSADGWPSGNAATPMRKSPRRAGQLDQLAGVVRPPSVGVHSARGPLARVAAQRQHVRTPAAA